MYVGCTLSPVDPFQVMLCYVMVLWVVGRLVYIDPRTMWGGACDLGGMFDPWDALIYLVPSWSRVHVRREGGTLERHKSREYTIHCI